MEDLGLIGSLSMFLTADMTPGRLRATTGDLNVRIILCATAKDPCMGAGLLRGCLARLIDVTGKTVNNGSTMSGLCEDRRETIDPQQDVRLRGTLETAEMAGITVNGSILEATHYHLQWNLEGFLQTRLWDRTTLRTGAICLPAATRMWKGATTRRFVNRPL